MRLVMVSVGMAVCTPTGQVLSALAWWWAGAGRNGRASGRPGRHRAPRDRGGLRSLVYSDAVDAESAWCPTRRRGQDPGVPLHEALEAIEERATDATGHAALLVARHLV